MTRTVSRALAILDAFDRDHLSLTLQEISDRVGMAKATTFRLVNTLERDGYLVRKQNHRYCLSLKLVRLAGLVEDTMTVREAARSVMLELSRQTGETITLSSRAHDERIVIDVVETPSPLMAVARPGERIPLLYGAAGRMLLAHMSDRERADLFASTDALGGQDVDALEAELARLRSAGHAVSHGQRVPGLSAISVPIFDHSGSALHCLALSGPSVRVDPREAEFVDLLKRAGETVSRRLGAGGEDVAHPRGPASS